MLLSLLSRRSLEVDSRDAYGFALRPQHIQRYIEYSSIYKEEEEERSTKWKDFLEHGDKSVLFYPSVEKFREVSQAITTEKKEESVLKRGRVGDDSGCSISDRDVSTECNTENEVQLSKGPKEEVQLLELPDKEEQLSERPDKEFQRTDTHRKQVQLSQKSENSVRLSEESEKEEIHSKATKTHKIQTWAQVRPSVHIIENMMSYRVKKRHKMKEERITASGDHLPSINEKRSSGADTVEDVANVTVKTSEDNVDFSKESEDDAVGKRVSPKTLFSRREELESLVHGGVPKDLRGEVWQAFVGVKARHVESYYQDLLAIKTNVCESKEHSNSFGVPGKFQKQIEKDIPRTFPGHPALDEDGRDSLRRLLIAYALHNPAVGYCQAMNFFAGILLLLMPEENAFWTFVGIMDDYFDGYYTEEMIESQVDQLVFEELMGERFPKLVNHLDYLGVQVAWISGPWFLSIFVNMLPWESVLRVWDVLLFEGNRVMLFRTALALMELYGSALLTTKDAGDAITLLQSLAGSTFDSSKLVFTACMGFLAVTENRLEELREKHRPAVLLVIEERSKQGRVWKDSKGLASKLYSFKHDSGVEEVLNSVESDCVLADGDKSRPETRSSVSSNIDELLSVLTVDSEVDSLPDLQEQVVWLKVELCRSLEEKRSAVLRAEELETALVEIVKQDNRRELSARIEHLELEVVELRQSLADKREQEVAMLQVLMRVEQEQRITEDARLIAEKDAAAQRYAVHVLEEKYEKAEAQLAQMEKRVVMAESMLEATLQYQSGQARAQSSPRSVRNQSSVVESQRTKTGLLPFGLGWRDKNKGKLSDV